MTAVPYFSGILPWGGTFAEDRRFRQLVTTFFIASLIFSIVVPLIDLPAPVRDTTKRLVPDKIIKLKLKKPIEKKPDLSAQQQEALRRAEEERRKKLEEDLKRLEEERRRQAELDAKKRAEELAKRSELDKKRQDDLKKQQELDRQRQLDRQKELEQQRELDKERQRQLDKDRAEQQAREAQRRAEQESRARAEAERARKETEKRAGAEKARNELAGLSDLFGGERAAAPAAIKGGGTLTQGKDIAGTKDFGSPSVIATTTGELGKGSGGVDTKKLGEVGIGRGGGTALGPRAEASVSSENFGVTSDGAGAGRSGDGSGGGGRGKGGKHAIDLVIEQNKGRISSLYQRLFRRDPTQTGKVAVKITIKASGEVESVEIISSAIKDDDFLTKLKNLLKGLNFGPDDSQSGLVSVTYPFDFIPEN